MYMFSVCVCTCTCSVYVSSPLKDPDYVFDLTEDNPEFKKLAFVAPGPKNAFALLKRSTRRCIQRKDEGIEYMNINDLIMITIFIRYDGYFWPDLCSHTSSRY